MSEEKTIRIIIFSGKKSDWRQWSRKFLAVAHRRGIRGYLDGTETISSSSSDDEKKLNMSAYNDLLLSMKDDVSFGLVDESTSSACPEGDARLAWTKLESKFESQTSASRVKLMNQFTSNRLRKMSQDPDVWISELELIRTRLKKMGTTLDDMYVMMHVLNNLPSTYNNLVDGLEDKLGAKNDPLTLEGLREKLSEKYEKIRARKKFRDDNSDSEGEERALFAGGKFKGRCHYCGKFGHKASECRKKKNDNEKGTTGEKSKRFDGKCNFCGKYGHKEKDCWEKHGRPEKRRNEASDRGNQAVENVESDSSDEEESALITLESLEYLRNENEQKETSSEIEEQVDLAFRSGQNVSGYDSSIWLGDTGASCHMTNSTDGLVNLVPQQSWIVFGNGQRLASTHIGELVGIAEQKNGEQKQIRLKNVKLVPELYVNLFSLSAALKEGCVLQGSADELIIKKGRKSYTFDQKIKSGKGYIFGIKIMGTSEQEGKKQKIRQQSYNIMTFHEMLRHASEKIIRSTANKMGIRLEGHFRHCDGCALGKMKKKNVPKDKVPNAPRSGDRLFLDISSIKYPSMGGAKYLCLMMDDHSGFVTGSYLKKKSDLQEKGINMIQNFENDFDVKVKRIRCDNAGENQSMEKECVRRKMGITFEYTSVGTPQQNGQIKRKFATLYGRVRAMFVAAGISGSLRKKLWAEAMNTAIDMNNIIINQKDEKTPYEVINGKGTSPRYSKQLRRFGEIGVILNKRGQLKSKMVDRGTIAMMVGYHRQSAEGVYRMLNLETHKITQTRDVRWTQQMYHEHTHTSKEEELASSEEESDIEKINDYDDKKEKGEAKQMRLERALRKLDTFYNPVLMNTALDEDFCFVGGTDDNHENPDTFREAWEHKIPEEQVKWREAIRKEFSDMLKRKVWKYTKKSSIPANRRLIGNKWVFKKKRNGVYRARLVGLGYSQVPGIDHKDNFSPVVSEITFRIVMILALLNNWDMEIVDVVTAFLYGDLEETIFMKIPAGLEEYLQTSFGEDDCVILDKSLYGLVQAARQFHKKLLGVMKNKLGFEKCKADECLLWKKSDKGSVIVCVYIDDTLCVGDNEAIDDFKRELKKYFDTKEEGEMYEYVGCKVRRKKRSELIMYQDDLLRKIEKFSGRN